MEEKLTESQWLDNLLKELKEEHGIDTSEWEYKYGDNAYTAAEFLARAIKGYNETGTDNNASKSAVSAPQLPLDMEVSKERLLSIDEDMLVEFANLCAQYPNEARANLWEEVINNWFK